MKRLQDLELSHNTITTIHNHTFLSMDFLDCIQLSHNSIQVIEIRAFCGSFYLARIYLDNNQIRSITPGIFSNLPRLFYLHLEHNMINDENAEFFKDIWHSNITRLDLENNWLTKLPNPFIYRSVYVRSRDTKFSCRSCKCTFMSLQLNAHHFQNTILINKI